MPLVFFNIWNLFRDVHLVCARSNNELFSVLCSCISIEVVVVGVLVMILYYRKGLISQRRLDRID